MLLRWMNYTAPYDGYSQVSSTVSMTSVTCGSTDEDECAMTVDEESFDMTGTSLECGVCNLDGEIIEVASADTGGGSR